jgi:hypothetical protein
MSRRKRFLVSVLALSMGAVLAGAFAYWRARGEAASAGMEMAQAARVDATRIAPEERRRDAELAGQKAAELARSQLASLARDPAEALALGRAVGEAINLYQFGSAQDYVNWLNQQGLTAPDWKPAELAQQWTRRTQDVAGAKLYPGELKTQVRVRNGQVIPPVDTTSPGKTAIAVSRADRGANDVDPGSARTDAIEVVVPGDFRTNDGATFHGALHLTFAHRPSDGKWIIIRTGMSGFPPGRPVTSPPL